MGLTERRFREIEAAMPMFGGILDIAGYDDSLADHGHNLQRWLQSERGMSITLAEAHAAIIAELHSRRSLWTEPECALALRYGITT